MVHVEEQPSRFVALPSSQASCMPSLPSPHTSVSESVHAPPAVVHTYPGSTRHTPEQPSPAIPLPSSHSSVFPTIPSPHVSETGPASGSLIPLPPLPPEASGLSPVLMSVVPPFEDEEPALVDASAPSMPFG